MYKRQLVDTIAKFVVFTNILHLYLILVYSVRHLCMSVAKKLVNYEGHHNQLCMNFNLQSDFSLQLICSICH